MKIRLGLILLSVACLLSTANSQCELGPGSRDVPFPDIHKYVADSYIMGVEYSVPLAQQTDYYTEYYEVEFHKGRIDGHQAGQSFKYMYNADNWESWNVELNKCELRNITQMPEFYKDDMTEWVHNKGTPQWTTVGPSAMFKVAYDVWNNPKEKNLMTYKGRLENATVRGEKAVYYRRCLDAYSAVEYYFGAPDQEDAFDVEMFTKKFTPLRVVFFNLTGKDETMASQFYDILFFQHSIPSDMEPFALPKGRNCSRDVRVTGPAMPNFNDNNMLLSAEVLYQKFKLSKDENQLMSSYYSTLMFAVNHDIDHIFYYYSSWNTTKPDPDHQLPFVNLPHKIIYDLEHEYTYKINTASGKCTMSRDKTFNPTYMLPEGGGVDLTDPLILFPNNEFVYLDKARERGLRVNVYEVALLDYILDAETKIPKMVVTHSYLTDDEEAQNTQAIKNSPTQIVLHMYRKDDIEEVLTFNIYGFTTKLPQRMRRRTFDVSQCFKNDDDYMYLTIGFEPDEKYIPELTKKLDDVEDRIIESIKLKSTLNAVRIPYVVSEVRNNFILVTLLILDKPAPVFEFTDIMVDKTVKVGTEDDKQGVSTFEVCADQCLEGRNECWGFALCGGVCSYGSDTNQEVIDKKGCTVYKRYNNKTALQSNAFEVNNIVGAVESGQFPVEVTLDSQDRVPLKAVVAQITDPAEDESLYTKMGNLLNPRMRVIKTATKLKKGDEVKNMGKLRYDECQQLCLDFKDCETLSYCLVDSNCKLSSKFAIDLNMKEDTEADNFCNLLSRKYADHFDRTPGVFATSEGGTKVDAAKTVEDCARECLKTENNNCMSFDHCAGGEFDGCRLYNVHYKKTGSNLPKDNTNARCGHYSRKFSAEFKMKDKTRISGAVFQELTNLTLEECAKRCIEYDGGACYGYDFCQGEEIFSTWCYLIDSDPSQYKSDFSAICRNYLRTSGEYSPRPYTSAYAGGIGFLCFIVGAILGIAFIFIIAYIRVNRG